MTIQTLILTHFNVRFLKGRTYNLDPQWLIPRFEFFETYCLPSVVSQTSKDFKWILFFDKDTPVELKERAENFKKIEKNIEILYLEPVDDEKVEYVDPHGGNDIKRLDYVNLVVPFNEKTDYKLTVRLDNDDAIASTYIEKLQKKAKEIIESNGYQLPIVVNCKYGLQLFLKEKVMFKIFYPNNHFLAMLSTSADFHTIYECHHYFFRTEDRYVTLPDNDQLWIETVSQTNVSNAFNIYEFPRIIFSNKQNFGRDLQEYEHFGRNLVYLIIFSCRLWRKIPGFIKFCFLVASNKVRQKLGFKKK